MKPYEFIIRNLCLVAVCLTLAGCETSIGDSMASMRDNLQDRWSNMKLFTPGEDTDPVAWHEELSTEEMLVASENCPNVAVANELGELHQFSGNDSSDERYRVSSVRISDVASGCRYNEHNVVVEMNIRFEGEIGPHGRVLSSDEARFAYPYFIAIASEQGNIMAKEVFAATLSFPEGEDKSIHVENVNQIIPISGTMGDATRSVLVGFQLSQQQLSYNRHRKSMEAMGELRRDELQQAAMFPPAQIETLAEEKAAQAETVVENKVVQEQSEEVAFDSQPDEYIDITEPIDITAALEN
jgi:hypothetical protein